MSIPVPLSRILSAYKNRTEGGMRTEQFIARYFGIPFLMFDPATSDDSYSIGPAPAAWEREWDGYYLESHQMGEHEPPIVEYLGNKYLLIWLDGNSATAAPIQYFNLDA